MKIKANDKVRVMRGKDAGKEGKVTQVFPRENTVVVEGVHIMKKHLRGRKSGEKGSIIELSAPINVSNVMLIDPASGKPTRVGYTMDGGQKKRIAKKSKTVLE